MLSLLVALLFAPQTLDRVHSHNDYLQRRPLLDALDAKIGSIEADIFLVEGELLVAHDRKNTTAAKTLRKMYLQPLAERARKSGMGVYGDGIPVILLIDIKTEGDKVFPVLKSQIREFKDVVGPGKMIVPIVSGDRPIDLIHQDPDGTMAIDGRTSDLDRKDPLIPLVSDDWSSLFKWRGLGGEMPMDELKNLRSLVQRAHANGQKLRFWGGPDNQKMWEFLYSEGVDLIGTDHPAMIARVMKELISKKTGTHN